MSLHESVAWAVGPWLRHMRTVNRSWAQPKKGITSIGPWLGSSVTFCETPDGCSVE